MANGTIGNIIWLGVVSAILIVTSQNAYKAFLVNTTPAIAPSITPSLPQAQPAPSIDLRSPLDRALLSPGAHVDAQFSKYGRTALMSAALLGEMERAKILLQAGANPNIHTGNEGSALCEAVRAGNLGIAKLLLQSGIDPKSIDTSRALMLAVDRGNTALVDALLQGGANPNSRVTTLGEANQHLVLRIAALSGRVAIVKRLVQAGADPNLLDPDIHPILLSTLIGSAVSAIRPGEIAPGQAEVARILVAHGANPNGRSRHNGTSVLTAAVAKGPIDLVQMLIRKGASVNTPGAYEQTALMFAAERGSLAITKLLLDNQANVNTVQRSVKSRTALYYAVKQGSLEVVKLILERNINVNAFVTESVLEDTNVEWKKQWKVYKKTALDQALELKQSDIAALLTKHGAKPYAQLLTQANRGEYSDRAVSRHESFETISLSSFETLKKS